MPSFNIDLTQWPQNGPFSSYNYKSAVNQAFMRIAPIMTTEMRAAAPKRSGALANSIQYTIDVQSSSVGAGDDWQIIFWSDSPYASYVIYGTEGGGPIFPVNKLALSNINDPFATEAFGPVAMVYNRGAIPANPFPEEVAASFSNQIPDIQSFIMRSISP